MNPNNRAKDLLDDINQARVSRVMREICREEGTPRDSGVLAIATTYSNNDFVYFASISIGNLGFNFGRYALNASEKIQRLYERRKSGHNEVAASESVNPKLNQYGGCIFFQSEHHQDSYISFSGAPAEIDEALVYVIGEVIGFSVPKYENPFISRIRELFQEFS